MMSKEEIKAKANEWIRSQGWSEETLPSDEYNQMVSAYVAGHYAGWNAKADDINEMGICFQSDMDKALQQNFELKAGKPKWHKVADGDYPPCEKGNYTISVLTDKGDIAYYSYNYDCWIAEPFSGEIDPPIAWCEIPRFEGGGEQA